MKITKNQEKAIKSLIRISRERQIDLSYAQFMAPIPGFRQEVPTVVGDTCWSDDEQDKRQFLVSAIGSRYQIRFHKIMADLLKRCGVKVSYPALGEVRTKEFLQLVETHNL